MSFLEQSKQITNSALFSLQTQIKKHTDNLCLVFPRIKKRRNRNCKHFALKRISSVISITYEGSLTIEAALVIPIFLFAIIAVLSFADILRLQMKTDSAMTQCAKELAVYGYAEEKVLEGMEDMPFPVETLLSETYVRNRILSELGEDYLSASPAKGSGAIHFVGSRIMENDRIELRSAYYVIPFFALSPGSGFLTGTCAVARAFTGYDNLSAVGDIAKEEFVYITPEGTAYHKSRGCHYLDLSIEKVFADDISGIRNKDGGAYYACPLCKEDGAGTTVFITSYGDRYHRDVLCSGLKRTVEMVPISETGGRHPCPKCGN